MFPFYEFRKRYAKALPFCIIAGLTLLAWWNRFIQDDAFISFRYADNLARGVGLVWNVGERVEGYTNFLWTVLLSGVIALHGDPVLWATVFGLVAFACSLYLTYRIALYIFQSDDVSLIAVCLLGTNYTFSAYATGGLETSVQAFLYAAVVYRVVRALAIRRCRISDALFLSVLLSVAMLLRLDSALLCLVVFAFTIFTIVRQPGQEGPRWRCVAALCGPFVAIIGAWFAWKLSYYGDILPNTFYLKVTSVHSFTRGIFYLHKYLASYLFYPIAIVSVLALKRFLRSMRAELFLLFLLALLWMGYVVKVGGDFMEFRFVVPILPIFALLFMWLLFEYVSSQSLRIGFCLLVLLGSVHHVLSFSYDPDDGIEPIAQLQGHVDAPDQQWAQIGRTLGEAFGYDPGISIATTAAGAIPYYSRLTTVDMLGLSDRTIAKRGFYFGRAAGHERIATLSYLQERKVNLIVAHPYVTALSEQTSKVPLIPGMIDTKLPESKIVEIPLDAGYKVVVLYLTPNARVDSVIAGRGWKVHQLVAE